MRSLGHVLTLWLADAWRALWELLVFNLLWLALTLPLVTAPPAIAGLYYATNQLAHEKEANWRTFLEGFRRYFWLSWRWMLANLLVAALVLANYLFYGRFQAQWGSAVQGVFLGLLFLWVLLQIYTFPLLLEQADQRLFTALRNSLVFYLRRPGFALGMALFLLAALYLLTRFAWPTWLVVTAGLNAYLANHAVLYLIKDLEE
ncbi:MAG: DUF624 domain-containing protein [Anaerolineales bacterium]|nr:DUF624 domain-containing protein [Anaerolineales bacterium]